MKKSTPDFSRPMIRVVIFVRGTNEQAGYELLASPQRNPPADCEPCRQNILFDEYFQKMLDTLAVTE